MIAPSEPGIVRHSHVFKTVTMQEDKGKVQWEETLGEKHESIVDYNGDKILIETN